MSGPDALATKIASATAALGWVEKRGRNQAQSYDFVTAEDIIADVRQELHSRNVAFVVDITDIIHDFFPKGEGKAPSIFTTLKGTYSFIDGDSGQVITGGLVGSAIDAGDKGIWKAWTGALKYLLRSVFLLPTGDDPEEDGGEKAAPKPRAVAQSSGPAAPPAERVPSTPTVGLTTPQKAKLFATFGDHGVKDKEVIKGIVTGLTGKHSTSQMSSADLDLVLNRLAEPDSDELINVAVLAKAAA